MNIPFTRAIVDHHYHGEITVELAAESTYNMQKPHYYCIDFPEWGVFDLDDLDFVKEI